MKLVLIAAFSNDGGIGRKNKLPWRCANDMAYFRKITMGDKHACVMGRKTWESLPPKKLPGRQCIVLSSQPIDDERCVVVKSFDEAKAAATALGMKKLIIIGGSTLFNEYYDKCDELHLTHIHEEVTDCDTFFNPVLKPQRWRLMESQLHPDCTINRWLRR